MRVMLLGAGGMLGHDLIAHAPETAMLFAFTKAELDITATTSLSSVVEQVRPDIIINAAAYTQVDRAESEPERAFRVNGEAVGELGRVAKGAGVRVVHFSTDYIFDGTASEPYREEDPTNPVNVYGASKLAGEHLLTESGARFLVIRTQWLFGVRGKSFPRTMWERALAGARSRVVSDQVGRPTYSADLAEATWKLVASNREGVLHVANAGIATWYDVARLVYSATHAEHLVQRCSTAEVSTAARRPAWSVLGTSRLERALGGPLPRWEDSIDRFVAQMQLSPSPKSVKP